MALADVDPTTQRVRFSYRRAAGKVGQCLHVGGVGDVGEPGDGGTAGVVDVATTENHP
ncbi:hypothetical protein [Nocardia sp. NPDC005745]|uniref:hypothetical protein n=1 Tax=Nocardia sp. NPDC005745 TaxID=3157061 RepID=UPI00340D1724